ncbi:MAG: hypothetical protein IPH13_20330 [Planctomycetes bacterium]|nr:hypothetical protein [Planctomycetota bacterium]
MPALIASGGGDLGAGRGQLYHRRPSDGYGSAGSGGAGQGAVECDGVSDARDESSIWWRTSDWDAALCVLASQPAA